MDASAVHGLEGPLSVLDADDRAWLEERGTVRTLDRDDVLVRQGERSDDVAVILGGRVRVVVSTLGGRSILLAVRGPGAVIGELSAIDGAPRSATVSAMEPVTVRTVRGDTVRALAERRPRLAWALLEATVARLRESDRRFVGVAAEVTRTRVARTLLEVGAKHGRPVDDGILLDLPLSQEELAGWVGASREGVSAALSQLRRDGAIATRRMAVTILDLAALREVALGA